MSYVARTISAESVKKGIYECVPFFYPFTARITGTTYGDIIKQTIDFTDIDYLCFVFTCMTDGNTNSTQCLINAVQKFEDTTIASGNVKLHTIDCTALTGELAMQIQCKNSNGVNKSWLEELIFYNREA